MKTEKKFAQQYFDSAEVFMVAIDKDEIVIDINKKGCEALGYSKDEVLGKNWFENFLPKPQIENMKKVFHNMLSGSMRHVHYEHPIVTKHGEERVMNWHNILSTDENSNVIGSLSSGSDVTEQRIAESAAKETENRLQRTFESMLEGCQIIDYDYRYAYVNESASKQGRLTKQQLIGHTMMELYPGIDRTEMFSHLKQVMTSRVPHHMENEFTFPDGSKGWFDLRIEPVPEGVLILSIDVTQHKELEEELEKYRVRLEQVVADRITEFTKTNEELKKEIAEHRKTEEKLLLRATILDNARTAIFLVNKNGDFVYANKETSKSYGYSLDELFNMNIRQLLPPQEAQKIESRLKQIAERGQLDLETTHMKKDKSPMPVQVRHTLIKTMHGEFIVSVIHPYLGKKTTKPNLQSNS